MVSISEDTCTLDAENLTLLFAYIECLGV